MQIVELYPNTFVIRGYNHRLFTVRHKRTRKKLYRRHQRGREMTTSRIQKIKNWQRETINLTYQKIQDAANKQMETK